MYKLIPDNNTPSIYLSKPIEFAYSILWALKKLFQQPVDNGLQPFLSHVLKH